MTKKKKEEEEEEEVEEEDDDDDNNDDHVSRHGYKKKDDPDYSKSKEVQEDGGGDSIHPWSCIVCHERNGLDAPDPNDICNACKKPFHPVTCGASEWSGPSHPMPPCKLCGDKLPDDHNNDNNNSIDVTPGKIKSTAKPLKIQEVVDNLFSSTYKWMPIERRSVLLDLYMEHKKGGICGIAFQRRPDKMTSEEVSSFIFQEFYKLPNIPASEYKEAPNSKTTFLKNGRALDRYVSAWVNCIRLYENGSFTLTGVRDAAAGANIVLSEQQINWMAKLTEYWKRLQSIEEGAEEKKKDETKKKTFKQNLGGIEDN